MIILKQTCHNIIDKYYTMLLITLQKLTTLYYQYYHIIVHCLQIPNNIMLLHTNLGLDHIMIQMHHNYLRPTDNSKFT